MAGGKAFAVDIPVIDLDENIDDFRFEEMDDNLGGAFHNDNVSIDLSNLDFGSKRAGIFKKGLNSVSSIFRSNKNKYISRNGDYTDDIELINRHIDNNSDDYFDFDNDGESYYPQYAKRSKFFRFIRVLSHSKLFLYTTLAVIISLLITLIVLVSRSKHASSGSSDIPSALSSIASAKSALTLVLAIGGLHPHFISEKKMPFLTGLLNSSSSVYSPYMIPSNPSSMLTNLWTISTGLYPAENGIVADSFYDSDFKTQFSTNMETRARDPRWWLGEPIWTTAREHDLKVATFNWPGTDLIGSDESKPNTIKEFKRTKQYEETLKELSKLLSKRKKTPDLVLSNSARLAKMIENHGFSGNSFEKELFVADEFISAVYDLLKKKNILESTNVMIVSDGGYAPIGSAKTSDRILYLDDLVDMGKINHVTGFPIVSITPIIEYSISEMVLEMNKKLETHKLKEFYEILEVDDEISTLLYGGVSSDRISPIVIIPRAGYTLRTKKEINSLEDECDDFVNGFKNDEVLSRSVFIGTGPMFTKAFENYDTNVVKPFNSIEIYDMISHSLNLNSTEHDIPTFEKSRLLESGWKDAKEYPGVDYKISILKEASFIESKFGVETELVVLDPISEEEDTAPEEAAGVEDPTDETVSDSTDSTEASEDISDLTEASEDTPDTDSETIDETEDVDYDTSGEYNMIGDGSSKDDSHDNETPSEPESIEAPYDSDPSPVVDTVPIPEVMPEVEAPAPEDTPSEHHSFWDSISGTFHDIIDDIDDLIHSKENDD